LPTAAEWDYAARVGTSNPPFAEKYADQASDATGPVKSHRPNAWGFYDMVSTGWERVSDSSRQIDREDAVDPQHIPPEDRGRTDPKASHGHFAKGKAGYALGEVEYIGSEACPPKTYPGVVRFRIVVED
jgi:formylglycine-generating enzyme required for sulfatase activity